MTWAPAFGALCRPVSTEFRLWAPAASRVEAVIERTGQPAAVYGLTRTDDGFFSVVLDSVGPGDLYRYRVDGRGPWPDPASRFQPQGVHGPSQVVDSSAFEWTDQAWAGIPMEELVLYELHVGTFTREGTFSSAARRLPLLQDLGITAVELMPVADFPGERNWGYDGVALFAPARRYGSPDDLRRFVDSAHQLGLAVHLDVVYNHIGPDGSYLAALEPQLFSARHRSPWGKGINFDGPGSAMVRCFFIENALHWIHEYHIDGLRLDATHAIVDESPRHFLAELAAEVHHSTRSLRRRTLLIAEDNRNLPIMASPALEGGWDLDGVWSDDFHHQIRRCLAGDRDAYFADFDGSTGAIAATLRQGWFYCGQDSPYFGGKRGADPCAMKLPSFVICIQNHDQTGNRAMGDRLHHGVSPASYRAASALLLLAPETPLLFMGQEWAASTPFQFFTDHHPELGRLVTEGRRREFARFRSYSDPAAREKIPDPQDLSTFARCRLNWDEAQLERHASVRRLYEALLRLRRTQPALRSRLREDFDIEALGEHALWLRRRCGRHQLLAIVQLRGDGVHRLPPELVSGAGAGWKTVLTTEDSLFCTDPVPILFDPPAVAGFRRPGAAVLAAEAGEGDTERV